MTPKFETFISLDLGQDSTMTQGQVRTCTLSFIKILDKKYTDGMLLIWERLNGGTVPPDKTHPGGTVPPDKTHPGGTVPPDKTHPGGTVPPDKTHPGGTIPP